MLFSVFVMFTYLQKHADEMKATAKQMFATIWGVTTATLFKNKSSLGSERTPYCWLTANWAAGTLQNISFKYGGRFEPRLRNVFASNKCETVD